MNLSENALFAMIFGCEVAFWVVLVCGLAFRYIFRWDRASWFCLVCVPLIDVVLLILTVLDLRGGANSTTAHGLAMAYVGFTVAFGSTLIGWADGKFAHKFAGAPPAAPSPDRGWPAVRYELRLWGRCLLAVAIINVLLTAVIAFIDRPAQTKELEEWYGISVGTLVMWFIFGPLWSVVFFKREQIREEPTSPSD